MGRQKTNSLPNQQYWSKHNKKNSNTNQDKGSKLDKEASHKKQQRCCICNNLIHLSYQCKQRKTESSAKSTTQKSNKAPGTNMMIQTNPELLTEKCRSCCVDVKIEGAPTTGVIDTRSYMTIIRGDLFYYMANLKKIEDLKAQQQKVCTFDLNPIILDGQMSMKVSLGDRTVTTTVSVKLVAPHLLLLSETVCRFLEIVSYQPSVQTVETKRMSTVVELPTTEEESTEESKVLNLQQV